MAKKSRKRGRHRETVFLLATVGASLAAVLAARMTIRRWWPGSTPVEPWDCALDRETRSQAQGEAPPGAPIGLRAVGRVLARSRAVVVVGQPVDLDDWGKEWLFEAERLGKPVFVFGDEPDPGNEESDEPAAREGSEEDTTNVRAA